MPRGGYRPGAGRPKGSGNKSKEPKKALPGPDKKTKAKPETVEVAVELLIPLADDATPLDYMLQVMRDPHADPERRDRMALGAAPYMHGRKAPSTKKDEAAAKAQATRTGRFDRPGGAGGSTFTQH